MRKAKVAKREQKRRRALRRRLVMESLEDRQLLTGFGDPSALPAEDMVPECTLRAALMETNAHLDLNAISFRIANAVQEAIDGVVVNSTGDAEDANPGDGVCDTGETITLGAPPETMTIVPSNPLPPIRDVLDLDGRRSANGVGIVPGAAIDGTNVGGANGLVVKSHDVLIRGLSIQRFPKSGIAVEAPFVQIANNYIGLDLTGKEARGNLEHGVLVNNVSDVWVGFNGEETRGNVISANGKNGVLIVGAKAQNNFVSRNYIGLTVDGENELGNGDNGVEVARGATRNTVGPPSLCLIDHGAPWPCHNVIAGNQEYGVVVRGKGTEQNVVTGNRIGTDKDGQEALSNRLGGILLEKSAARNSISDNLISGNAKVGVKLLGGGVDENTLEGNTIGLNVDGSIAVPNSGPGVWLQSLDGAGPQRNRIGSNGDGCDDEGEVNVISGNQEEGVRLRGRGVEQNQISGNVIGLDPKQNRILGNRGPGIRIDGGASRNRIGMDELEEGGDSAERNTIAGNGPPDGTNSAGVWISGQGTVENVIAGNWIGTNRNSDLGLGNYGVGVRIDDGATDNQIVPGKTAVSGVVAENVIAGQGTQWDDPPADVFHGIYITGVNTTGNVVAGNLIGATGDPERRLGNRGDGVAIDGGAGNNRIGVPLSTVTVGSPSNTIAFNGGDGVHVTGSGTANTIRGNAISANGGLGINLEGGQQTADSVTLNDYPDYDSGPNRLINFPVLYYASKDAETGKWTYEGQLLADGGAEIRADFYGNSQRDPSAYGEGASWKETISVDANADRGIFQFVSDEIPGIAGTATGTDGSTSEFGPMIAIPIDLDGDTDNTGEIDGTEQEERDELTNPGMVIMYNWDDDDGDGKPDYEGWNPGSSAVIDDDLVPIEVRSFTVPDLIFDDFTMTLTVGSNRVKVWTDQRRSEEATTRTWRLQGSSFDGETLYVEGVRPGWTTVTLTLTSPLGTVVAEDMMIVSIVDPNLTAYRPKSEEYGKPFQRHEIPEEEEIMPGIGIRRNGDDDNNSGIPDNKEFLIENENDLIEVEWAASQVAGVDYRLNRSNSQIHVFDREKKWVTLLGDDPTQTVSVTQTEDRSMWVEWPGDGDGSSDLIMEVVDQRYGRVVQRASQEKLRFSPFNSLVIVIGGRGQDPADPVNYATHGMFQLAIDLYRQDGYDVRMYQEKTDVEGNNANGAAIEEIIRAVNDRGVTSIAIIGYSQGGGSTYDLSSRIQQERINGELQGAQFSLEYTAYVDAIRDEDSIPFDPSPLPESRRPIGTAYHVNQYQKRSLLHGTTSRGDVELDRTGLGVDHMTIDDHPAVQNTIKQSLRGRVKR